MSAPDTLWVVLDHSGRLIQNTTSPEHVEFMTKYVEKACDSGDGWSLVEYRKSAVLAGVGAEKTADKSVG